MKSIRIDRPFHLPPYVREALQKLSDAGHTAYLVGGGVRDFLLNRESKDYDIATSALPDQLCELFPKSMTMGKAFGVLKVPIPDFSTLLEIATFREDLEYHDSRHPRGVLFSGPQQDAQRRDFTINALFYDPKTSRILDFTRGIEDLSLGVIRAIGNPHERFKEDALRLLRAIRFKTRLGFKIEAQTFEAIRARSRLISKISPERIRDELNLIWTGPKPDEALSLLSECGILAIVLPEVETLKLMAPARDTAKISAVSELWSHLLKALRLLAEQNPVRSPELSWVTLLHEIGKAVVNEKGSQSLKSHSGGSAKPLASYELESAKMAERITVRLKMSREESKKIATMVGDHLKFKDVFRMRESTLQRLIRDPNFEELLAFHKADAVASDGNLAYYEFCASRLEALKKAPLPESYKLVDGKDLIQLGFSPGPEFSEILRILEDLALEKQIKTKEEALEYVVKYFVK